MAIRQIKHKVCDTIVTLEIPDMPAQGVPPEPELFCPACKRYVTMAELTPRGTVCVLFTQK